jgi:hypothetical protein
MNMEKDIGRIKKNETTDVVVRIDDFGGKIGLTIREFVTGERYTGFTKAGTRIAAENFNEFKGLINSIDPAELTAGAVKTEAVKTETAEKEVKEAKPKRTRKKAEPKAEPIVEEKVEAPEEAVEDY